VWSALISQPCTIVHWNGCLSSGGRHGSSRIASLHQHLQHSPQEQNQSPALHTKLRTPTTTPRQRGRYHCENFAANIFRRANRVDRAGRANADTAKAFYASSIFYDVRCAVPSCAVPSCAVLCCAVLCCAVLCCAVLCCAVLCCAVPCRAVLCCAVLCCAVLCCAVLCCAVLCCARLRVLAAAPLNLHAPPP